MEAKDVAVWQPGIRRRCSGEEAALLRQGIANAQGDGQEPSQAVPVGQARNTGRSSLPIIGRGRILGTCVRKGMCLLREI